MVVTKEIKKGDVFNLLSNKKKKIKVKIHILWEDMKEGVTQGKKNIYIYIYMINLKFNIILIKKFVNHGYEYGSVS